MILTYLLSEQACLFRCKGCSRWRYVFQFIYLSKTLFNKHIEHHESLLSDDNFVIMVNICRSQWPSAVKSEHHGLLANLWKGQAVAIEVLRAPGSISSRGGPPPCHPRRVATTTWLAETSWSSKIHLAESDRWGRSAPELWGPHGLEEDKGQGCLASSRQYGNAVLGVRR